LALLLSAALLAGGCATQGRPRPVADERWLQNAFCQTNGEVSVWLAVPDPEQTRAHFGIPLEQADIQPVWLRVANHSSRPYWLLPAFTDPDYFSSAEVNHRFRSLLASDESARRRAMRIEEVAFDHFIPPGSDQSGFLYTPFEEASQVFSIALLSTGALQRLDFFVPTTRLDIDHGRLDDAASAAVTNSSLVDITATTNLVALRRTLEQLPAHTRDAAGKRAGDPINFFVIAPWTVFFPALIAADWDETELLNPQTALRTTQSLVMGTAYRHSPVSPLFIFGRRQDAAFQKIRENINARNHLRLWRLPLTFAGQPVWAGQISRDIGVRFTHRTPWLTTHEIDPDVDGARWSLVQDLIKAQCLAQIGFVEGGILATPLAPRHNLTGDDYFTDGLRAVLFLSPTPLGADEIQFLPWSYPPRGGLSQPGDYLKPLEQ
jgi:hypothetical protein